MSAQSNNNEFTERELVTFGNYLLSNERNHKTSELNQNNVTHADIENWKEMREEY
jgi:hypothetical protein